MRGSKIVALAVFVCGGALLLTALSMGTPDARPIIDIRFARNEDSPHGPVALLRLENRGGATVRINAYCTLYWTNRLGMATNAFFRHDQDYAIIRPGESNLVRIPHPHDAKAWEASFTYQVRPSALVRLVNRVRFYLLRTWVRDDSFIGRFGPTITNPSPSAEKLRLIQQQKPVN